MLPCYFFVHKFHLTSAWGFCIFIGHIILIMKKIQLSFLLLFLFLSSFSQKVDLVRESVNFVLDAKHVLVSAELVYKNTSAFAINQMIFVPMPLRKSGLMRDTLVLFDMTDNRFIREPRNQPAGLLFGMAFEASEQKKLRVCYTDDHNGISFTYPMKMQADYWQGPLSFGSYTLKYDETLVVLDSTSMLPDNTTREAEETILTWKRSNFKPEREFEVWFHKK